MTRLARFTLAATIAGALALGARPAAAHLMAPRQGTVNVVGSGVFAVLSVPASALQDADDDHDGLLDAGELERHEAALRAEIDRRLVILDGATPARTVRVDLVLSPEHGAPGGRAAQVVALKHAELDAPPADLRVRSDLFGAGAEGQALTITATRHPASGTETQVGVLTPDAPELAFFPLPQPSPPREAPASSSASTSVAGGLRGLLAALAILGIAASRAGRPRARVPAEPASRA